MKKPFCYVTKQGKAVRQEQLERYATKGSRQVEEPFTAADAERGIRKPPTDPVTMINILDMNVSHAKSCATKAQDIAGSGWYIAPAPGSEDSTDDEAQGRKKVLEKFFSGSETAAELKRAHHDYEAVGWAAVEVVRSPVSGLPVDLFHVPSETIRIHQKRNKFLQRRGNKIAWFRRAGYDMDVDYKTGREAPKGAMGPNERANDLLWWTNYKPGDDYYGRSDVVPALGAVLGDVSRRDYNISFFDNYGVPAYAVFVTGDFDPGDPQPATDEEKDLPPEERTGPTPLEEEIERHFSEMAKNPHSVLVMTIPTSITDDFGGSGGQIEVEVKPLSTEVKDASFRMYRQDNRDEILSAHGVDPYRAGLAEVGALGGTTATEATSIYKESVVQPRQNQIEELVNSRIVSGMFGIDDWVFKLNELDSTDLLEDLQILTGLFTVGAVTPAEIAGHFADRYGLDSTEMDHPALKAHYVGGEPVDIEAVDEETDPDAVVQSINNSFTRLSEFASRKEERRRAANGNGSRHIEASS